MVSIDDAINLLNINENSNVNNDLEQQRYNLRTRTNQNNVSLFQLKFYLKKLK